VQTGGAPYSLSGKKESGEGTWRQGGLSASGQHASVSVQVRMRETGDRRQGLAEIAWLIQL